MRTSVQRPRSLWPWRSNSSLPLGHPSRDVVQRRPDAAIPDDDVAGAVVARRDRAFEVRVLERVIFDQRGEALVRGIGGRTFGYGPRTQRAVDLEAHVEVQVSRAVLLDDEHAAERSCDVRRRRTKRFGGRRRTSFVPILSESGARWLGVFLRASGRCAIVPRGHPTRNQSMAARATGSGTISFGLVAIPVKLYSTVDTTKAVHFNYLSQDGSRLKQQYIRASDGKVIEPGEKVQGYEFQKGQYVTFTPEEMKAMDVEATNAIEIAEFIPLNDVERIFIEKIYYLGPDKGAARSYHLLRAALAKTGHAALAKYAARGKSYLVLLRPMADGLVMEQLKHVDELRPFSKCRSTRARSSPVNWRWRFRSSNNVPTSASSRRNTPTRFARACSS